MTVRLKIFGRVQGVFFRRSAQVESEKLGLAGWARNEDDGSVEILASGSQEKLKKFVEWCKDGPKMAKVEKVEEDWSEEGSDLEGFEAVD